VVWRRRIALAWALVGLISLVIALNSEGSRESPTMAVFLMGAPYITATAQASAGLPFYLLSGVFLLLGFAALAAGDEMAAWLTKHWLGGAILLGFMVTALRFALEKTAAPPFFVQLVGVTWIAPVVGAFFFWTAREERRGFAFVVRSLVIYALAVRGGVFLLMLLATTRRLGSHYDVTSLTLVRHPLTGQTHHFVPGSLAQFVDLALVPQLVVWPLYTVAAGLLGAAIALVLDASWESSKSNTASMPSAPTPPEPEPVSARGRS